VGDGGLQYGLAELGTAAQNSADAKLLVIDDGGYGILREYQRAAFGHTTAVDLEHPNFRAIAEAFEIPVRESPPDRLSEHLDWALSRSGPAMVVVQALLTAAQPTT
jgi:acetolactate synthase-1/2/3 large subunit